MKNTKIVENTNNEFNDEMSNKNIKMDNLYTATQGDFTKPNTLYLSNTFCDPGFFTPFHI